MKDVNGDSFVGGSANCFHRMRFYGRGESMKQCCEDCGAVCACPDCSGLRGRIVSFLDSDAANYVAGAALLGFAAAVVAWVMR